MITLYRMIRCWQLRTKWKLALWQSADKMLTELIPSPEEIEKIITDSLSRTKTTGGKEI